MNALLIYPPSFNMLKTNIPSFVEEETGIYPPLGLLYIASYAQKKTNFKIEILDCQVERLNYTEIENEIVKRLPDVVGIQTFTFSLIDALKVADIVKKVNHNILVCMGGPHTTIYPFETVKAQQVDLVVRGEGEYTFSEILNCIEEKKDFNNVKGILFKKDGEIIDTGVRPFLKNEELDSLPHPARELIPVKKYYSLLAKKKSITTLITSRGCPFKCIFCDRPQMGKVFRFHSADNILNELKICADMGIEEIFFYDDTFTVNKKRVLEFCTKMIETGLNKKLIWDIRSRLDTVDEELLKIMKTAGCNRIHYGVESGTERILKILKKDINLNQAQHIFKITSKYGIQTLAYFILGNPCETKEEIKQTISFAKKIKPDYVHFSVMTPYPGTELYKMALQKGVFKFDYWKKFAETPSPDFIPFFWEENFTREELIEILYNTYKNFYLRPSYILKHLSEIDSFTELKRKVKAGLRIIRD